MSRGVRRLAGRLVPALEWLPSYRRDWLSRDVVAGLTTAAVILPKAMAYGALAGLPVQAGLYTALVPTAVYAHEMLIEAEERLCNAGTRLWLARLNPAALDVVQRSPLGARLGRERMFFNANRAVETYLARQSSSSQQPGR